jgi:prepilin-type N-terminal cleavage/methylation domain-containing protein
MKAARLRIAAASGVGPRAAFTLIELLVAMAIAALLMMVAIPYVRKARKTPLVRATADLVEACQQARIKAILGGTPMQVVIFDNGGAIGVEPVPGLDPALRYESAANPEIAAEVETDSVEEKAQHNIFEARLDDEVAFRQLLVNGRNMMLEQATAVRFFPNGTCDAMEAELQWLRQDARRITLDLLTGQAIVEAAR